MVFSTKKSVTFFTAAVMAVAGFFVAPTTSFAAPNDSCCIYTQGPMECTLSGVATSCDINTYILPIKTASAKKDLKITNVAGGYAYDHEKENCISLPDSISTATPEEIQLKTMLKDIKTYAGVENSDEYPLCDQALNANAFTTFQTTGYWSGKTFGFIMDIVKNKLAKKPTEQAEAICNCVTTDNKAFVSKKDVAYIYGMGDSLEKKGQLFAEAAQKYCASLVKDMVKSCTFAGDNVYGTGAGKQAPPDIDVPFNVPNINDLNKLGTTDVSTLIGRVIKSALGIIGTIAFALFVYAGVLWLISAGNSDRIGKAKDILVWTSLGIAVIFASYAIVDIIFEMFR